MTTATTESTGIGDGISATTSSRATKVLGWLTLAGFAVLVALAFAWVPEDTRITEQGDVVGQFDAVRLMFVHVPAAILAYTGFGLTFLASLAYLRWRTDWWDMMAHASAEIGVLFGVLTLVTGSIWGRPTWQTWWEWGDVRLVTTLVMVLVFIGYLAVRRIPADVAVKARRSAVIALVGAVNIVIVNRSVDWWGEPHPAPAVHPHRPQDPRRDSVHFVVLVRGGHGAVRLAAAAPLPHGLPSEPDRRA